MKEAFKLAGILAVVCTVFTVISCVGNPNTKPEVALDIPELFSPDPDVPNDKMTIGINVKHPAPIKDWSIVIQPNRQNAGGGQGGQSGEGRQPRAEGAERTPRAEGEGGEQQPRRQRRAPFFEQTGKGTPPKQWQWDGKSTRETQEMVQSATAYRFTLTVTDKFENTNSIEGIIEVDVLVRREGDDLRIIVPAIVFPPNSANFALLSEDEMRANRRVLRLIANALNKYDAYAVTVEGHANPTTPPDTPERAAEEKSDQTLSEQRAQAVVDYLGSEGNISRSRLASVGMSCTRPTADYDDEDENWKNRRVEFLLKKG